LSQPEDGESLFRLSLPDDLVDAGEPVFTEPWQAQAFAMTVSLYNNGVFTWSEWAETFSGELKKRAPEDDQDGRYYYEDWLAGLETIVSNRTEVKPAKLGELKNKWEQAYRTTPHGEKVSI
jgi:nitrile hydratase accessory protein